jgi:DNA-binding XRE family transcriptional regulator
MKCEIVLATNNTSLVSNFKQTLPRREVKFDSINNPTQLNKIFRRKGEILEILILDLTFPAKDLNRFIFYIKQFKKDIPVILLTVDCISPKEKQREALRNLSVYASIKRPSNKEEAEMILKDLNSSLGLDMDKKIRKIDFLEKENVFSCTFKNGKTYFLSRNDIEEDDGSKIKHYVIDEDEYYFIVYLESGKEYAVPWDFVLSMCEEEYEFYHTKAVEKISPEKIGEKIQELRKIRGLTQEQLQKKTGILRANIARIERGRHSPSLESLEKIADALEVPIVNLISK